MEAPKVQTEYKLWKLAELKSDQARAAEVEAYEAFRKNLNKKPA